MVNTHYIMLFEKEIDEESQCFTVTNYLFSDWNTS